MIFKARQKGKYTLYGNEKLLTLKYSFLFVNLDQLLISWKFYQDADIDEIPLIS